MAILAIIAGTSLAQSLPAPARGFQIPVWAAVLLLLAFCVVVFILWKSRQD